jgi:hypothetical protein
MRRNEKCLAITPRGGIPKNREGMDLAHLEQCFYSYTINDYFPFVACLAPSE